MHEGAATLLEALWPTVLIGLAGFLLVYLFHVRPLGSLVPGAARWRGRSKQTEKLARMSEPATRCEVCLQETTMQCSRCKVVKYWCVARKLCKTSLEFFFKDWMHQ